MTRSATKRRPAPTEHLGMVPSDHDPDLERAVLAAVLLDGGRDAVHARISGTLRAEDFADPANRLVWVAMGEVLARGEPLDLNTLGGEMRTTGQIHVLPGGAQYLGSLTDVIPTTAHVEAHAALLAELGDLRRAREALDAARLCARSPGSPAKVMGDVRRALAAMPDGTARGKDESIRAHAAGARGEVLDAVMAFRSGRAAGVPWGLASLDGAWTFGGPEPVWTEGLLGQSFPGQLIALAAPPGAGKTSFAWQTVETLGMDGGPSLFLGGEMHGRELVKRRAAQLCGVSQSRLRSGNLTDAEVDRMVQVMADLERLPIRIENMNGMTHHDVRAHILAAKARDGIRFVVIDYLQTIALPGERGDAIEQYERVYGLKHAAVDAGVPILALSSMTKAAQRDTSGAIRPPSMADLFGSGGEFAVDVMAFLVAEPDQKPPVIDVKFYVTKNRSGEAMNRHADLSFDMPRGQFRDAGEAFAGAQTGTTGSPAYVPDGVDDGRYVMSPGGDAE